MILALHPFFAVLSIILYIYAGLFDVQPRTQTFLDRSGEVVGTLDPIYDGVQIWTPINEIPGSVINRTLQKEDRLFWFHPGVNPVALAKAAVQNISSGKIVRGGSTITQQLAKNLIQEKEGKLSSRDLYNKARETALAMGIEAKHSKDWILERYLNTAYYGRRCYGIAAAARCYFSKNLDQLNDDEIALLVSLPRSPNRAPNQNNDPIAFITGRHFVEYVASRAKGQNVIQTTLDLKLQRQLEQMIGQMFAEKAENDPLITAAAVVIDVASGEVLAMDGSRDYFDQAIKGQFNAAVALRQPGSALKPFTYFAAFAKGFSADTIVPDEPVSFYAEGAEDVDPYIPQNFDRRYHGEITIRQALANSYNVPAVITLNEIGISYYHNILRQFGFTTFDRPPQYYGLSVTLGSGEVTLLELTNAYAVLARGGRFLPYYLIKGHQERTPQPVIQNAEYYAKEITNILSDPGARLKAFGFNDNLTVEGYDVAVKTGTSYEHRDNWAVGYNAQYAVGVWVGHADGSPLDGTTGASGAAPIWHACMETLLRGEPNIAFAGQKEPQFYLQDKKNAINISDDWKVVSPLPHTTYRIRSYLPRKHQLILAEVKMSKKTPLKWFVDDELIAETASERPQVWLLPDSGDHLLAVRSEDGETQEIPYAVMEDEL